MKNITQVPTGTTNLASCYSEKYDAARLKTVVFEDYSDPYLFFKDFFYEMEINSSNN